MSADIEKFLEFLLREKGCSTHTIVAYKNDLGILEAYLDGSSPALATSEQIGEFVAALRKHQPAYAVATVARRIAVLKSFFNYLQAETVIRCDPMETIKSPKVKRFPPKPLSVTEVEELLRQPLKRNSPEGWRDRAMLELLYATGLRVSELVELNLESAHLPVMVSGAGEHQGAYVRVEGSKERVIPIHDGACSALADYLYNGRLPLVKNRQEEVALFVNYRGERLTRQGFWLILKLYAKEANLKTRVTPHTLRHSFATHMLLGGMNLRHVQELLGHTSISTTGVYTVLANRSIQEAYAKAHPRARTALATA